MTDDRNPSARAVPADDDLVVAAASSGYAIRRFGNRTVSVEGPFSVFGTAITAARTRAASEGVAVWLQSGHELQLVSSRAERGPLRDRRRNRLVLPACRNCREAEQISVVSRTPFVVYIRCGQCGAVWSESKPGQPFLSGAQRD